MSINRLLHPRSLEESQKVMPKIQALTNEKFSNLETSIESSGTVMQVRIPSQTVALVCIMTNTTYYLSDTNKTRRDYEIALELTKEYEKTIPKEGEWIVKHYRNCED